MKFLWKCFSKQQVSWLRELVRIHKPGWKKPGSQTPDREAIGKGETISLREGNPDYSKGHVLSFLLHCLHLQILDLQFQEKEHFEEKHQDTFPKGQIIEWVLKVESWCCSYQTSVTDLLWKSSFGEVPSCSMQFCWVFYHWWVSPSQPLLQLPSPYGAHQKHDQAKPSHFPWQEFESWAEFQRTGLSLWQWN